MEALQIRAHQQPTAAYSMNSLSSKLKPTFSSSKLKAFFCTSALTPLTSDQPPILSPVKAKPLFHVTGFLRPPLSSSRRTGWIPSPALFPMSPNL
ncbi:hypothetical protein SLA2020_274590 [Shorea laevis]